MALVNAVVLAPGLENNSFGVNIRLVQGEKKALKEPSCMGRIKTSLLRVR